MLNCNKFSDLSIWSQTSEAGRGYNIVTFHLISFTSQIRGREQVPLDRPARQMDRGAFLFSWMIPSTIAWNSLLCKRKYNKNLMWKKFSDNDCLLSQLYRLILLGSFIYWRSLHPRWLKSPLMKALRQIAVGYRNISGCLCGHCSEDPEHSKFKMGLDTSSCRTITLIVLFPRQSQTPEFEIIVRGLEPLQSLISDSSEWGQPGTEVISLFS